MGHHPQTWALVFFHFHTHARSHLLSNAWDRCVFCPPPADHVRGQGCDDNQQ
uniref:Uncharacterized protein n=1 Tax=Anguilla anguilla TaxID=7936 RepID=A0A0E9XDF8_ANGAN